MPSTGSGQRWACRSEAVATTRTESAPRRARQTSRSRCFRSLGASWVGALIAALRTWRSGLRARGRSARLGASDYDDVPGDRLLLAGASSHTPPCSINSFIGILHEFIWRAQNWGAVSLCATDVFHSSTQCGVRNMSDIPRQQELHSVKRRHGNVCRVGGCLRRQRHPLDERRSQLRHLCRHVQERQALNERQSPPSCVRISRASLVEYHL